MQVNSLLLSIIVAGVVSGVPATLAAQSCLGYALAPNQHSLNIAVNDQGGAAGAGAGGSISGVLKSNSSYSFQTTVHQVDIGNIDYENMFIWQAQAAQPVLRKEGAQGTGGPCVLLELGGTSFMETSSTNGGVGFGYSLNRPRYALYAAPVFGFVQSGEFNDTYLKVVAGAGTRFGALQLGADVSMPLQPSGGETAMNFRLGFAWGKATQIPATQKND